MAMNQTLMWCVAGVILCISFQLESISADLSVEPGREVTVQPEANAQVQSVAILTCNIFPMNATIDSRWILPNGQIISMPSKKYRIAQGLTDTGLMSSVLLIQHLSFKDEGFYTCEVVPRGFSKSLCTCNDFPLSATTKLELLVSLIAPEEEIVVKQGDDAFAQLVCEMQDYIRPDEDLLWFKGGKPIYDSIGSKFSITIEDGEQGAAQNGRNTTVASRQSVLRILNPTIKDSGEYVCVVRGTEERVVISLTVTEAEDQEPTSEANGTPPPVTESKVPHGTLSNPVLNGNMKDTIMTTTEDNGINTTTLRPSNTSCDVGHMQLTVSVICTFVITALVSVLLTLTVTCVCMKHKSNEALQTRKNVASPIEGNGVVSAVNTSACEEASIIPN